MTITPYVNSSDPKVVNKTLTQIYVTPPDVTFKDDVNMMAPVLIMAYDASLLTCNYVYIPLFNRYYYVTRIITSQQRLIMECKIDVLQSHSSEIDGFYALVARQADRTKEANLYLHDKEFRALAYKDAAVINFKNSSGQIVKLAKDMNMILTVAGGGV